MIFKKKAKAPAPRDGPIQIYYNDNGWLSNVWATLKSRVRNRDLDKKRIMVTITMHEGPLSLADCYEHKSRMYFDRQDEWTTRPAEELQRMGYKKTTGLYDSLVWYGVPVYMKIEGGHKFDVASATDANGMPLYSLDTSGTLNDFMQSNATENFVKGLGKISYSAMDIQKIIMIAIIACGAFFGMWMLGIF